MLNDPQSLVQEYCLDLLSKPGSSRLLVASGQKVLDLEVDLGPLGTGP